MRAVLDKDCPVICCQELGYEEPCGDAAMSPLMTQRFVAKKGINPGNRDELLDFGDQYMAGREVLKEWWRDGVVQEIAAAADRANGGHTPGEVTLLTPQRGTDAVNSLTSVYVLRLKQGLDALYAQQGKEVNVLVKEANVCGVTTKGRAGSTAIERLATHYRFDVDPTIKEGDTVVFVDDHLQNAGHFMTIFTELKARGANMAAATVVTASPNIRTCAMNPDVRAALLDMIGGDAEGLNRALGVVGLSMDSLTNREGLTLVALMSDNGDPGQREMFARIAHPEDIRGLDSLTGLFERPGREPLTIAALGDQLAGIQHEHRIRLGLGTGSDEAARGTR